MQLHSYRHDSDPGDDRLRGERYFAVGRPTKGGYSVEAIDALPAGVAVVLATSSKRFVVLLRGPGCGRTEDMDVAEVPGKGQSKKGSKP